MALAVPMGLLTSIALETFLLCRREGFRLMAALKTALSMSFLSMLGMETASNITEWILTSLDALSAVLGRHWFARSVDLTTRSIGYSLPAFRCFPPGRLPRSFAVQLLEV